MPGRDRHRPGRYLRRLLAAGEQPVLDHRQGVALNRFHDRVDLDGVQQVVGEEHQQAQAGEQQHDRAADREPGEGGGPVAGGDADRIEPGRAVGKGRHEDAEHDLIRPVPQEVAQQPRRELGRGQLQRHHRQAEQQRDDGDHGPGDPDQQRRASSAVPWNASGDRGSDPDQRQQRPRGQGGQHRQFRQYP